MSKTTYKYNPDSLQFEPVDKSCKGKIFRFIRTIFGSLLLIILFYFLYVNNFQTIKAKMLVKKNNILVSKYSNLNNEFKLLESELEHIAFKDDNMYRTVLEKEPLDSNLRNAGTGGTDRYQEFEKYLNYELLKSTALNLDKLTSKIKVQESSLNDVYQSAQEHKKIMDCIPAIQPVSVKDFIRISSYYGYRTDPVFGGKRMHKGLDFPGSIGTEIYATGEGVVVKAGYNKSGYGNEVVIKHHAGYSTRYAHLNKLNVKVGEKVKRGQLIAFMGNTGKSTGPHLHYEVRLNGKTVDPINYYFNNLSIEEFEQIVKFSEKN